MQSLFLTEYIKSNLFIESLHNELSEHNINVDLILSDINYNNSHILTINQDTKPESVSLIDARKDAISASKHPLIILNELNINFLDPIIETLNNKKYTTIINIHAWLWSYWKKLIPEINDLDFISKYNFDIFEPIDLENLRNIFRKNWKQYIRLLHKEMPDAIFDVDELWIIDASMLENLDSISLKTYWFTWNDWVIFVTGSLFATAIQTWEILQKDNKQLNIFLLQKLNLERTKEMVEDIKNSKKLFILFDHDNSNKIKEQIEWKFKNLNIENIEIDIVSPKYNNVTTIFNEYQDEQSDFNPEKIAKRIISKL